MAEYGTFIVILEMVIGISGVQFGKYRASDRKICWARSAKLI